jgi:hypothetical protein
MAVKLRGSYETEIFVNQAGYVAIKQVDSMGGEDSVICLTSAQLPTVIAELQALYDDRSSWETDGVERTED